MADALTVPFMRRILVGLDGSPLAEAILPFVEWLATKHRAGVTLLHVVPVPEHGPLADHPAIDQIVRQATTPAEEYLRGPQGRLAAGGLDVTVVVTQGQPAREIVRHADQGAYDLVALATHGRSGIQQWAHGSVADDVLRTTSVPLGLVRPGDGPGAMPRRIQRIVVPLDGSPEAEAALRTAEPLAIRGEVPLTLLRFVAPLNLEYLAGPNGLAYVNFEHIIDDLTGAARSYLDTQAAQLRARGIAVTTEVAVAPPAAGIAAYVGKHPESLIVLATHGRSGWRRLLLGSVARRVALTVTAPLVLCPPRATAGSRH